MSRDPDVNRNTEFAPIRVMVWSGKLSSARESRPVRIVEDFPIVCPESTSFASLDCSLTFTSLIFLEITADLKGAALKEPITDAQATIVIKVFVVMVFSVLLVDLPRWRHARIRNILNDDAVIPNKSNVDNTPVYKWENIPGMP